MTKKVNILYLITSLNIGGAERVLVDTATNLNRNQYKITVGCLKGRGPLADELEQNDIRVICFNMAERLNISNFFPTISQLLRIYKFFNEVKPDILHSHLFRANFIGRIIGKLSGVPLIISTYHIKEMEESYGYLLDKLTIRMVDCIVTVCNEIRQFLIKEYKINPDIVNTIYNGIDVTKFSLSHYNKVDALKKFDMPSGSSVIGTIGRLHRQKGHCYLLKALFRVVEKYPEVHCIIAGEGGLRLQLEQLTERMGLKENVTFLGQRKDIINLFTAIDIFVLSSLWEGLPVTILEALACGKPVIATRVSGVPEIIEEGVNGLLVEPANAQALADAILWVLENPEKARKMAEKGKEKVEKFFSIHRMVKETEKIYAESVRKITLSDYND